MTRRSPGRTRSPTSSLWLAVLWSTIMLLCQSSLSWSGPNRPALSANGDLHAAHLGEGVLQRIDRTGSGWEGSVEEKTYSEFNHRLAGALVVFIGLGELQGAWGIPALPWMRFLLPGAMLAAGSYLVIWSDHDAWPIGSQTFSETVFGGDAETSQHKLYAVMLLVVGSLELLKRSGRLSQRYLALALPALAAIGGSLLFLHAHSDHPSAQNIAIHHVTMGGTALMAGWCLIVSEYGQTIGKTHGPDGPPPARWKSAWGVLVLSIGVQLLVYAE